MYLHSLTLCQYTFNIKYLHMSILFSNFAVRKERTLSPPETRLIGCNMKDTLKHISDETLEKLFNVLNDAYEELRIELDEERNDNSFYWKLLTFSVIIDNEYFRRQEEKERR